MDLTKRCSLQIPFAGFYSSLWSSMIESREESEVEYWAEHDPVLDKDDYADIIQRCIQYKPIEWAIARDYAECFDALASAALGFKLGSTYEEMTSPREYNFETDRIFVNVSYATVLRLFARSKEDEHATLRELIRKRFTSRDGFMSWYRNDLESWLDKPLGEWDHNEVYTLLEAVLNACPDWPSRDDWEMALYYDVSEHDFDHFNEGMDWPKFKELVAERQAEVLEAEAAEEAATRAVLNPDYVPPTPPCPETMDLFGGQ